MALSGLFDDHLGTVALEINLVDFLTGPAVNDCREAAL